MQMNKGVHHAMQACRCMDDERLLFALDMQALILAELIMRQVAKICLGKRINPKACGRVQNKNRLLNEGKSKSLYAGMMIVHAY